MKIFYKSKVKGTRMTGLFINGYLIGVIDYQHIKVFGITDFRR